MRIVLRYDKYPCNRQVTGVLLFSQMEHIHQKQQGQSIVGHHGHQIVDRRDQRAGGHRRHVSQSRYLNPGDIGTTPLPTSDMFAGGS